MILDHAAFSSEFSVYNSARVAQLGRMFIDPVSRPMSFALPIEVFYRTVYPAVEIFCVY